MSQETLNLIKRSYEEAVTLSTNLLDLFKNLHDLLKELNVVDEDRDCLNAFINNLNNYYCI